MRTFDAARGRWPELLECVGVHATALTGKHGPCPMCAGKDRFRYAGGPDGIWHCNQCGSGNGMTLAARVSQKPFAELAAELDKILNNEPDMTVSPVAEQDRKNKDACNRLWGASRRPEEGGPVYEYLKHRIGRFWASEAIREGFAHNCPAMISRISDQKGNGSSLHITLLTDSGRKAEIEPNKRVMAGRLPDGCAVQLWKPAPIMGIAEGIETAMSAAIIYKMPVWAAINGTLLAKWQPPEIAEEIHIFADNDYNFTGQAKAYALANRLAISGLDVKVDLPDEGCDWNDMLLKGVR